MSVPNTTKDPIYLIGALRTKHSVYLAIHEFVVITYQCHHMPDVVEWCRAWNSLPVGEYPEMTEAIQYGEDDGRRLLNTKHTHKGPLRKTNV